jgi:hypothetical protein
MLPRYSSRKDKDLFIPEIILNVTKMVSDNYQWFIKADMSKYKGKYVLIRNRKVVFSGENLKEILNKFEKKYPKETPMIAKIPKDELLILVISSK